ncbi:hypothetical protein A2W67_00780 [Candidatus Nomurabacteria bacterium RIFCSPLOWO2_02_40_28]|uniref:Uncharacterized protein n=2 Tax=Candidatus Nomuraibacteriota TaxID=1752729 RepID=A0A837HUW9_9BACT|nr:MAG: hypothetical protein UT27_C0003G0015 [Candidatus Nomurabacteria bacterium GW2011_GWD2_39_12]KKR20746.1 MAG: hypothetical protein UT51_C0002G0181 [Candidatus Nomurabacteria bacterium GW2011_GWC2_39_41]KKR37326.1 MAG: hypothetical protein UT70_C0001G0002 [Candidatus Nomurabacteria bacterium GW2011_GWE2_40_10]KKR38573.1 MAG: hypothetical protein UT73_C0002G0058 [Candidatus Nomurabacteria bacterium GW2011_GWB1_40_11]KKR40298.1 MAG: hypothetical protein UT74_C0001G0032 [Parcubacteria group b
MSLILDALRKAKKIVEAKDKPVEKKVGGPMRINLSNEAEKKRQENRSAPVVVPEKVVTPGSENLAPPDDKTDEISARGESTRERVRKNIERIKEEREVRRIRERLLNRADGNIKTPVKNEQYAVAPDDQSQEFLTEVRENLRLKSKPFFLRWYYKKKDTPEKLEEKITSIRKDNERMRQESNEFADGVLDAVKRAPKNFFNSVKTEWNGGKIVELNKKLVRLKNKIERQNKSKHGHTAGYGVEHNVRGDADRRREVQHSREISPYDNGDESSRENDEEINNVNNIQSRELTEVYENNLRKVLPENTYIIWQNINAQDTIMLKENEVSEEFKSLFFYLQKLHKITEVQPTSTQTVEEYIKFTLQKAERMGRLDQVKLN